MATDKSKLIAIVGLGAILPDAASPDAFWQNVLNKRYSITETPPERWRIADYYDPDPRAPDKTYSKIGGWVRGFQFDWKRFRTPPKVAEAMDEGQQWAVTIADDALADYGYPQRPLDTERTAVILGTAMGGERHYYTRERIVFPEYARALEAVPAFGELPAGKREAILDGWRDVVNERVPAITEDSMPGELPNIVAGRVANMLNLRGPNFITDAACASSLAALEAAIEMLADHKVDAVVAGGVDHNMDISSFVKFCKIGALSATGSRPFGDGADGFVMGEGAAAFLLKRLEDAERAGDKIYAVIRGVGGASDGKGKGITAPNPIGQQLAMERAWENAGLDRASVGLMEAHGTSTKVGDVVEVDSLAKVFGGAPEQHIALGSVKSNIGHLKAGAGAAGLLKAALALHHKTLPPTLNADPPNPHIELRQTPFFLNHETREWKRKNGVPRRCGVSAYGFGGTNFHVVLEEYSPGMAAEEQKVFAGATVPTEVEGQQWAGSGSATDARISAPSAREMRWPEPPRGILALGAGDPVALKEKVDETLRRVENGWAPPRALPGTAVIRSRERLVVDFGDHEELRDRLEKAQKAMGFDNRQVWQAIEAQGVFRGTGPAVKDTLAFLFPGQGSQYVNMGRELVDLSPAVAAVFAEADQATERILGKPLTDYIFVDPDDAQAVRQAEWDLMQTAITQPAVLTLDIAVFKLLESYGFAPAMVMGHSLGEYAALIAAGVMPFAHALEAAAARGREMSKVSVEDNGKMAAVLAPLEVVEATVDEIDGYVVPANINSHSQCVVGGASAAVDEAVRVFEEREYRAIPLPVSHAFHTDIVAPASAPLRQVLDRLTISPAQLPLVANVTGDFYPTDVEAIKDILQRQIASPVQWVRGLETLYGAGVRTFVEVGPKRALRGFARDVFADHDDVVALMTNHPKIGALPAFNQALCGLYAAGFGVREQDERDSDEESAPAITNLVAAVHYPEEREMAEENGRDDGAPATKATEEVQASQLLAQLLEVVSRQNVTARRPIYDRNAPPPGSVVVSGTGLGLPGAEKAVMDPDNALRILRGEQFIDLIPERFRQKMVDKGITRLVKSANGNGRFEPIADPDEVIKLAGRPGAFDLTAEYGVPEKLVEALDVTTQLAMAAGLDALREAGIPLIQIWKRTTTGKFLPQQKWLLPESLRDDTGVIFASAFPGGDRLAAEFKRYYTYRNRVDQLELLESLRQTVGEFQVGDETLRELNRRITTLRETLRAEPYAFDRRFIFRILAMGHSQFAEYIGARGPNTHVNAACASTTQGVALAEDWIRSGRCRRVIVIAADDVTGDNLMEWVGSGFLALGAAATDDRVDEAAVPFDRRRHGTILGMGACALVVESEDAVRERGMRGIVELLASETRNSAYHGSRLDVEHIATVMDDAVTTAERRFGLNRHEMARHLVFMSHETYTPARGGSASAEVVALRETFGAAADDIVIANTKGFTGHPMGVGVEDVIALKILEHGIVPPVPNHREVDPDLGRLNLSRGGRYPVRYALHLAAGFGSQIAFSVTRRIPGGLDRVDNKPLYRRWLDDVSGYDRAELEVVQRNLRFKADAPPMRTPVPNRWQAGTEPTMRAPAGDVAAPLRDETPPPPEAYGTPAPEPVRTERYPTAPTMAEGSAATGSAAAALPESQPAPTTEVQAAPAAADAATDVVAEKVVALVAEQTGYPEEMLELDLDLEADLGVDTVKQAEMFAAIREAFTIPRRDDLQLRDYPTLGHVIGFVKEMRPDLAGEGGGEATTAAPEKAQVSDVAPSAVTDVVTEKVVALVAEQTGYPEEMLELDLDLEADLGVDTVKQAETFAAIREAFTIPRRDDLQLRDYPTLGHVIGFVKEMRPDLAGEGVGETAGGTAAVSEAVGDKETPTQRWSLEDADEVARRVPTPSLRPPLAWCKPTGVTLEEDDRVLVMMDRSGVGKALVSRLQKRGVTTLIVEEAPDAEALQRQVEAWLADGPVHGVYWLAAMDVEPELAVMDLSQWRELNRQRVKNLYVTMRALYDVVAETGTFLISATRLGGLHGYGDDGATAPLGGAVVGFTKAYKRERPDVLVKAIDFEVSRKTAEPAEALIAETLADPGVVEVGYRQGERFTVTLCEEAVDADRPQLTLDQDTVFLVTGAAGGITSAIVDDLATASGGVFYLLDLVTLPAADDARVALYRQEREALKAHLIAEAKARGEKVTPVAVEKELLAVERQEAALRAVEAVNAAGGRAVYRSVDLLDGEAVAGVVAEIDEQYGRIDVLIHAAGVEISKSLDRKEVEEFDLVFDVKADGFFNLLRAAAGMPVAATVAFSSVAGRFGNSGQTDYSAANDLLCKVTSSLRRWRPATRGIAIDWSAWAEIGMATRGSIPRIMEMAGIEMLPPSVGVPTVRRELLAGRGEIVTGGALGVLTDEWDETGGLDVDKVAEEMEGQEGGKKLLVGSVKAAKLYGGLEVTTTLDPREQPFLYDHALDDTPLLPGVMGVEAFAQVATFLAPGYRVAAVENVQFHAAFKFYKMEPQTLHLSATAVPDGDDLLVSGHLRSRRELAQPEMPPKEKVHFTATVRLTKETPETPIVDFSAPPEMPIRAEAIYELYFHGPAYQVLDGVAVAEEQAVGLMAQDLPPNTDPAASAALMAPRLIELCFQTAGVWEMIQKHRGALPATIGAVSVYRRPEEAAGKRLYAIVDAVGGGDTFAARVVDESGHVYVTLSGYGTVPLPGGFQI